MEHNNDLNERCDYDTSVPVVIEIRWNQLVEIFRINELSVICIDGPELYKHKLWNKTK